MGYKTSVRKKGVINHFTEQVDGEEFHQAHIELFASRNFDELDYVINDFSEAHLHPSFFDQLEVTAAISIAARYSNPKFRKAFVLPDKTTRDKMVLSYTEIGHEENQTRAFATLSEAESFVDSSRK